MRFGIRYFACVCGIVAAQSLLAQPIFQLTAPTGVGTNAWVYTKNTSTTSRLQEQGQFGQVLSRFQRQTWEGFYLRIQGNNVGERDALQNLVNSELIGTNGFVGRFRPDFGSGEQVEVTATYNLLATSGGADLQRRFSVRNLTSSALTVDLFFGVELFINAQFGPDPDGTNDLGQLDGFASGSNFGYKLRELETMLPSNVLATDSGMRIGIGDVNAKLVAWQTAPRLVGQGIGNLENQFLDSSDTNLNSTDFPTLLGTNHIGIQVAMQYRVELGPGDSTIEINPNQSITTVPEPASLIALTASLATLLAKRRRNRSR